MSVADAQRQILQDANPVQTAEILALEHCLHRVLSVDLCSDLNVPPADNSAMDGFAVRHCDMNTSERLRIVAKVFAGAAPATIDKGQAVRIFTGATIPHGADTVLMQEDCEFDDAWVRPTSIPKKGENIRPCGQDITAGQRVLLAGQRLQPAHLGVAASVGAAELTVRRRIRVAILSTGDELLEPGDPPVANKIYNSNRVLLQALLGNLVADVIDAGVVADSLEVTKAQLKDLSERADLIISTGGVSVGEADFVKQAVSALGSLSLWKLAIKPGKPLAYGHVGGTPFFGLPGNPVSVFATFTLIVRPYLLRLQGVSGPVLPQEFDVVAGFDWHNPAQRQEYVRVRLSQSAAGANVAELHPNQSSGVLSSVAWADGLVVIPPGQRIDAGESVRYLPINQLAGF